MMGNRGQVLPLALILVFIMGLMWITVINIGVLIKTRIQMQIIADTAAQSACAIRARALSSIGRMNSWLGTPVLGIGTPMEAWWPDAAPMQQEFITMVRDLQEGYNRAYGGGWAAHHLVLDLVKRQGADGSYSSPGSYSLGLQINHGPIWYLSTVHLDGVPIPSVPQITEDDPGTRRWYEQGPNFSKKSMRVYVYRNASSSLNGPFPLGKSLFNIGAQDLYAVAAARVYNRKGPMFPDSTESSGLLGGKAAMDDYTQAIAHWQSQLMPVGGSYEH
jgi:hypothetical protein